MKEKIVLLLLFFLPFTGSLMAQVPISITKDKDINFGTIAASSGGGTVILSASGRTASGGIILPSLTGTVSTAQFTVTGDPGRPYAVSLVSVNEDLASGGATDPKMTISVFKITTLSNTAINAGQLSATGRDTVFVAATLPVGASQAAGSYNSTAGFEVAVRYTN